MNYKPLPSMESIMIDIFTDKRTAIDSASLTFTFQQQALSLAGTNSPIYLYQGISGFSCSSYLLTIWCNTGANASVCFMRVILSFINRGGFFLFYSFACVKIHEYMNPDILTLCQDLALTVKCLNKRLVCNMKYA